MGSIADNNSGAHYGYRASKAACNALGRTLAMDLKKRGIAVVQLHPGFVKTRMVNFNGLISPQESAIGLAERIETVKKCLVKREFSASIFPSSAHTSLPLASRISVATNFPVSFDTGIRRTGTTAVSPTSSSLAEAT